MSKRNPPMIPASMIPTRHKFEDFPSVLSPENPGGNDIKVVAEVQAVEVEAPTVETPVAEALVVKEPKKKYYYKPSITLPIVEPIAKSWVIRRLGIGLPMQRSMTRSALSRWIVCARRMYVLIISRPRLLLIFSNILIRI